MKKDLEWVIEQEGSTIVVYAKEDSYYALVFETREELDKFVERLKQLRDVVWVNTLTDG